MKSISTPLFIALAVTSCNLLVSAASIPSRRGNWDKKPAAFYLAGDSTTAAQSNAGGGVFSLFLPPIHVTDVCKQDGVLDSSKR